MLTVKKPPFSTSAWTHVLFTFENVNPADGSNATATLYLDGQSKGTLRRPLYFDWDTSKAAVMLGIHYVGDFDDLAIFNKALSTAEINHLRQLPRGAGDVKIENK
jgi:hypothetical protein